MTSREFEEYRALRATIRERSTARHWVVLAGLTVWAALTIVTSALAPPIATLLPLLLLTLTFEIVLALHTAVERVGRYIQVFFEHESDDRGWEHQAMEYGRQFPGGGSDPLFAVYFWSAIVLNLIPAVAAGPRPAEWAVIGSAHALALAYITRARRRARTQRAVDLDRFTRLRNSAVPGR